MVLLACSGNLFPEENWPTDPDYLASIKKNWVEPFGDMRQELVFIGQNLDEETMIDALDQCLLSDEELLKGKEHWATLPDPFLVGPKPHEWIPRSYAIGPWLREERSTCPGH